MKTINNSLSSLRHELEFLDHGGYRTTIGSRQPLFCMETSPIWKQPVFFEDSPICPKKKCCACDPDSDCVLMGFVPIESRHDALPCHHIPLNETGETIDSLHKTGRTEEIETALRNRLVNTIERLEQPDQTLSRNEQAA